MAIQPKKRVSGSTIAIIALSILLAASIGIGVALAYFTSTANVAGDITLGDPVTISITQGGASASTLTFAGDALPGSVYDQSIGISTPANTTTALVRAKLTITNTDGATTNVTATTTDAWTDAEDGYYYYKGAVTANSNIDFVTAITVPSSLTNDDANKTFSVSVIVEAIQQANNAANTVWTTAPEDWLDTYSPAPATGE
ncbi:MAG: SipW-dependent-type signal peptide-containing protein [Clostridia bacterium]